MMESLFSVEDEIDFSDDENFLQVNLLENQISLNNQQKIHKNNSKEVEQVYSGKFHPKKFDINQNATKAKLDLNLLPDDDIIFLQLPTNDQLLKKTVSNKSCTSKSLNHVSFSSKSLNRVSFSPKSIKKSQSPQLTQSLTDACRSVNFLPTCKSAVADSISGMTKNTKRPSNQLEALKEPCVKRSFFSRKSFDCIKKMPKKTAKFPGPAGILPKLNNISDLESLSSPDSVKIKKPLTQKMSLSQELLNGNEDFSQTMWEECHSEFKMLYPDCSTQNISSIRSDAALNKLENGKVKYICALVKFFVQIGTSGKLILKDPSGEINAAVHKLVLEEFEADLKPGTGLLLKDVSVFSPTPRKHYVNITPSNIINVFPCVFCDKPTQIQHTQMHTQVSEKENIPTCPSKQSKNTPIKEITNTHGDNSHMMTNTHDDNCVDLNRNEFCDFFSDDFPFD